METSKKEIVIKKVNDHWAFLVILQHCSFSRIFVYLFDPSTRLDPFSITLGFLGQILEILSPVFTIWLCSDLECHILFFYVPENYCASSV